MPSRGGISRKGDSYKMLRLLTFLQTHMLRCNMVNKRTAFIRQKKPLPVAPTGNPHGTVFAAPLRWRPSAAQLLMIYAVAAATAYGGAVLRIANSEPAMDQSANTQMAVSPAKSSDKTALNVRCVVEGGPLRPEAHGSIVKGPGCAEPAGPK